MFELQNTWAQSLKFPVTIEKAEVVDRLKKADIRLEILSENVTDFGALKQIEEIKRAMNDAVKILEKPVEFKLGKD